MPPKFKVFKHVWWIAILHCTATITLFSDSSSKEIRKQLKQQTCALFVIHQSVEFTWRTLATSSDCVIRRVKVGSLRTKGLLFFRPSAPTSATSAYRAVSARAARVRSRRVSGIKRVWKATGAYSKTSCLIQVHITDLNVLTVNSVRAWVSVPLIDNGVLLLGGWVFHRTGTTGEMMTLKSAG